MEERKKFFEKLSTISKGERAALRRCAGTMLKEANGQAITVFYKYLPYGLPAFQDPYWFAAACFACLWEETGGEAIERIMSKMKSESDSINKRLADLLDMQWDSDGFLLAKLTRIIQMMRQKGYTVDCALLLDDLLFWNSGSKTVQRKWAKTFSIQQAEETK